MAWPSLREAPSTARQKALPSLLHGLIKTFNTSSIKVSWQVGPNPRRGVSKPQLRKLTWDVRRRGRGQNSKAPAELSANFMGWRRAGMGPSGAAYSALGKGSAALRRRVRRLA